jgi:hypothetical protein
MKNRLRVYAPEECIDMDDLRGDINKVADFIKRIPERHKKFLEEKKKDKREYYDSTWDLIDEYVLDIDTGSSYGGGVTIETYRFETDEEEKARKDVEKKVKKDNLLRKKLEKEKADIEEKALFEKLKAKYAGGN